MRLPKDLDTVIAYLFKDRPAAEAGDSDRGATAFWTGAQTAGLTAPYLVTNRHVIEDGTTTLRLADPDGRPVVCEMADEDWIFPSDDNLDLAIARVGPPENCPLVMFPTSLFLAETDIEALDMRMGDDVCMVGRHLNYDGKLTNLPTSRFGHLVQMPGEPILDERGRQYSAFLVQVPSLPGFSGSPVFLIQDEAEKNAEQGIIAASGVPRNVRLLGVNAGHIPALSPTYAAGSSLRNPHLEAEVNSGISVVIPAWTLLELIHEDLKKQIPPKRVVRVNA